MELCTIEFVTDLADMNGSIAVGERFNATPAQAAVWADDVRAKVVDDLPRGKDWPEWLPPASDVELDELAATEVVEQEPYAGMTVVSLKELLAARSLETTGNKPDLIARLEAADAAQEALIEAARPKSQMVDENDLMAGAEDQLAAQLAAEAAAQQS